MAETNNTKNKVKFSLKRAYYAPATVSEDGKVSYGTPVRIPGAVSISLSAEGDQNVLRADGIDYYVANSNNGYSGDVEFALIPDDFCQACLGETLETTDKVLIEKADAETKPFAFLFEIDGDKKATRHAMYMCYASRPSVEAENPEGREAKTESVTIKAVARESDNMVKVKTTKDTPDTVYNGWYTAVYLPAEK